MKHTQPIDEWDFLPTDDEPAPQLRRYPELDAMHVVVESAPLQDLPAVVQVAQEADAGPTVYFDDEETEERERALVAAEEHELDLEELLESQHYSFETE